MRRKNKDMVCGKKKTSGQAGESRNGTGEGGLGWEVCVCVDAKKK